MVCTQCRTPNFSDYKFCRECGGRLDESGAEPDGREDPDLEVLVQDSFARLAEGDFGRALGSIQAALARNPESPTAHAALGLLYERQGDLPEAIHQCRVVLELCPDSTADRERLAALLARAGQDERPESPITPRRLAFACAVAATVLTFSIGFRITDSANARASAPPGPAPAAAPPAAAPGPAGPTTPVPAPGWHAVGSPVAPAMPAPGLTGARYAGDYPRATPPRYTAGPAIPDSLRQARGLAPAGIGAVEPISRPVATPVPAPQATPAGADREPVEPIETETGFIRIEPVEKPADRTTPPPPAAPPAGSPGQPRITVTISPGR